MQRNRLEEHQVALNGKYSPILGVNGKTPRGADAAGSFLAVSPGKQGILIKRNEDCQIYANEVGVNLKNGYNGDLTSREAGSIGGQMVKKMVEAYEQGLK